MSETINLDELLPKDKEIILGGETYTIHPLNVEQFLRIADLEREVVSASSVDEVLEKINQLLSPLVEDFNISKFNMKQLKALIELLLDQSIPKDLKQTDPSKKKIN